MRSKLFTSAAALASLMFTMAAHAGAPPNPVPEPGTWALVGLAAVVGWVAARGKRK